MNNGYRAIFTTSGDVEDWLRLVIYVDVQEVFDVNIYWSLSVSEWRCINDVASKSNACGCGCVLSQVIVVAIPTCSCLILRITDFKWLSLARNVFLMLDSILYKTYLKSSIAWFSVPNTSEFCPHSSYSGNLSIHSNLTPNGPVMVPEQHWYLSLSFATHQVCYFNLTNSVVCIRQVEWPSSIVSVEIPPWISRPKVLYSQGVALATWCPAHAHQSIPEFSGATRW